LGPANEDGCLFDHLVRAAKQRKRHRQRFSRFEIDDQVDLDGLRTGGGLFAWVAAKKKLRPLAGVQSRAKFVLEQILFQRGVDRRELGVEVRADAIHHGDDRERDAGRDQSVLDCGRAGLVFPEFANELLHVTHPGLSCPFGQARILIKTA
jgi:hypothetical protein